jgi:hypothetical protein
MAARDGDQVTAGVAGFALFLGRRLLEIAVLAARAYPSGSRAGALP